MLFCCPLYIPLNNALLLEPKSLLCSVVALFFEICSSLPIWYLHSVWSPTSSAIIDHPRDARIPPIRRWRKAHLQFLPLSNSWANQASMISSAFAVVRKDWNLWLCSRTTAMEDRSISHRICPNLQDRTPLNLPWWRPEGAIFGWWIFFFPGSAAEPLDIVRIVWKDQYWGWSFGASIRSPRTAGYTHSPRPGYNFRLPSSIINELFNN